MAPDFNEYAEEVLKAASMQVLHLAGKIHRSPFDVLLHLYESGWEVQETITCINEAWRSEFH
jgi:hypothetical protein